MIRIFQISLFLMLFISIAALAEEPVTSLRGGSLHKKTKELYIAASYPINHSGYEKELRALWNSTDKDLPEDSYRQKWKKVSIESLKEIFGYIDKKYYLIYPVRKMVKIDERNSRMDFDRYEIERREVQHAALFEWGCDDSIIPVISIGQSPEGVMYGWETMAISLQGKFEEANLIELDKSLIPPAYLSKMGSTKEWVTIEWPTNNIKATLVHYSSPATGVGFYSLFAAGEWPGYFSYHKKKGPMDGRC